MLNGIFDWFKNTASSPIQQPAMNMQGPVYQPELQFQQPDALMQGPVYQPQLGLLNSTQSNDEMRKKLMKALSGFAANQDPQQQQQMGMAPPAQMPQGRMTPVNAPTAIAGAGMPGMQMRRYLGMGN